MPRGDPNLSIGKIFSQAWHITWSNRNLWLLAIVSGFFTGVDAASLVVLELSPAVVVIGIAAFFVSAYGTASLWSAVNSVVETQRPIKLTDALYNGWRFYYRIIIIKGISVILGVFVFSSLLEKIIRYAASTPIYNLLAIITLVLTCVLVPGNLVVLFSRPFMSMLIPAIVLENVPLLEAMRRCWKLLVGNFRILWSFFATSEFIEAAGLVVANLVFILNPLKNNAPPMLYVSSGLGLVVLSNQNPILLMFIPASLLLLAVVHTWSTAVWLLVFKKLSKMNSTMQKKKFA